MLLPIPWNISVRCSGKRTQRTSCQRGRSCLLVHRVGLNSLTKSSSVAGKSGLGELRTLFWDLTVVNHLGRNSQFQNKLLCCLHSRSCSLFVSWKEELKGACSYYFHLKTSSVVKEEVSTNGNSLRSSYSSVSFLCAGHSNHIEFLHSHQYTITTLCIISTRNSGGRAETQMPLLQRRAMQKKICNLYLGPAPRLEKNGLGELGTIFSDLSDFLEINSSFHSCCGIFLYMFEYH